MKSKATKRFAMPLVAVGAALLIAALVSIGFSSDPLPTTPSTGPTIVCPGTAKAGGNVCGGAADLDGPIVVKAYLNGIDHMDTDSSGSGGINTFCFSTAGAQAGDFIEIRAYDSFGNETTDTVDIVDCE